MLYEKNNLLVFILIFFVIGAGFFTPAFAKHVTAEVSISSGSSIPECEETNDCFFPSKVSVDVGGKVVWSNDDTKIHALASGTYEDGPNGFFKSQNIMSGDTFSVKFDGFEPGDYTYFDLIYPWMIGIVTVEGDKMMPSIETETSNTEISNAITNLSKHFIQAGELAILWLGNHNIGSLEGHASAGFLLKSSKNTIVIDPSSLLSDEIDSVTNLDAIFITHDHGDHFDPDTTVALQTKTNSLVIADPTSASILNGKIPADKLIAIKPNEQLTISEITVEAFAAEHPTETPLIYIIEFDGFRIFHGSDSGFVEDLKNIESRVHVAMVPAGDPSPTASPQAAFEMTKATNPYVVIPMHGNPQQMQEFSNLVKESELQATVTIPTPLEIIIPAEVVPEFGLMSIIVLSSGMGLVIYLLRNKTNYVFLK